MTLFLAIIVALAIIAGAVWIRRRDAAATAPAATAGTAQAPRTPAPTPVAKEPAHPGFEWDAPVLDIDGDSDRADDPNHPTRAPTTLRGVQRAKLRDRYLVARFPGVAQTAVDLIQAERIIHSARLYFEDRKLDRAMELLDLAIRRCPADESMPLARLELAFLMREAALYVSLATAFRAAHASSAQWAEVARLGRAIAPDEAMFGSADGPRATDHYGPWPDMPNWMHAPWDLTAEVRATEFHQAMGRRAV